MKEWSSVFYAQFKHFLKIGHQIGLHLFEMHPFIKYFSQERQEKTLRFTFDGVCKVDYLVFVFYDFNTLSVRVISNAERTGNGFCIFSIIKE